MILIFVTLILVFVLILISNERKKMSLANKAILANLTISQWTGRKLDKRATGSVETAFSTETQVGNYTKKLLPNSKELGAITAISGEARKFFYENSLPWFSDGSRILSAKNYLDFVREIKDRKEKFEKSVSDFLSVYSVLRVEAEKKLGALFNGAEYPSIETLRKCFHFDVSYMPIPEVSDFRVEILDSEKETFLTKMREVENGALKECYSRLKEVVEAAVEKLSKPDAVFRDSLIENISKICQVLPKLNVNDSPELEATRLEVESIVSKISPDVCRENSDERDAAAKKLSEINEKLGAFMGVSK